MLGKQSFNVGGKNQTSKNGGCLDQKGGGELLWYYKIAKPAIYTFAATSIIKNLVLLSVFSVVIASYKNFV